MSAAHTPDSAEAPLGKPYPPYRRWVQVLAMSLVVIAFVLVALGGHVTSHDAGMAVPEAFFTGKYWSLIAPLEVWWYDFGRRLEHSHRLMGYLVGSLTIALVVVLYGTQGRRKWLKLWGLGLLVFVIVQGIMGILRVRLHHESWVAGHTFAAIHGVTGQIFLGCTVLAAAALGRVWMVRPLTAGETKQRHARKFRVLPVVLLLALVVQLSLGSAVRHSKSALAIPDWPMHYGQVVPPMSQPEIDAAVAGVPAQDRAERFAPMTRDAAGNLVPGGYQAWQVHLHFTHRLGGYLLFGFGILLVAWLWRSYAGRPRVLVPASCFAALLVTQVGLGVATVLTGEHPTLATGHQAVGALLIATAVWLTIRLHVLPGPFERPDNVPVAAGDATTEKLGDLTGDRPASEPRPA
ncbi:MAG: COX15/CtaA family protein [Planctomycetota bacterium]